MTPEQQRKYDDAAIKGFLRIVALSGDITALEKTTATLVTLGIGILRGRLGDEFVKDFLVAAIKGKDNVFDVEISQVH